MATLRYSSLDRGFRANIEEPSLFRRGVSMSVGGSYWIANEPAYDLTTKGGRVTFAKTYERSDRMRRRQAVTTLSTTFVNEYEDYRIASAAWDTRYGARYGTSQPGYVAVHGAAVPTVATTLVNLNAPAPTGEVVDPATGARIPLIAVPEETVNTPIVQPVPEDGEQ